MKPQPPDDAQTAFESETARFRSILAKGRSANQLALFDLLVERSRDQRSPKEVEIAIALFGNDATLDTSADSGVRVYVHRLRKRIDEHYLGRSGPRLVIPKGEYRIVLSESDSPAPPPGFVQRLGRMVALNPALSVGLLIIACAPLVFVAWNSWSNTPIEASGKSGDRPTLLGLSTDPLIAVGDSMLLAESQDERSIKRMILNPAIRTREDFGRYLKAHPESFYQLWDFNLKFAPIGAVEAAWNLQEELDPPGANNAQPSLVSVSALSAEDLESRDIVYVGRLAQLGVLEPQVFAQSRFRLAAYNRLVDAAGGRVLKGEVYAEDETAPQKDYGYLSVRRSPTGRRLIVLAGLGDTGTAAAVGLLTNPREIAALKRKVGGARHFETVFEILSRRGAPPQQRLVAAYPLR